MFAGRVACLFVAVLALLWVPVLAAQDEPLFFVSAAQEGERKAVRGVQSLRSLRRALERS